ncbi:hypothetical protein, variant [Sphaeroforma arctica JP610]|uniref:RAP domain-containing protein n=1 Tax=Sphaeroforma arctica JP610 TaxID=667725 RepID=A0A0L0G264_9EUKA|nr:hypothetical protein, variant [Sphaeroforma arctica JP610]KNC82916.1 hypothetical protein, variant [Sphaeroforma arctica JP610]|eukprot:XP_014156818.1 hypothetical protein, variant [Sphaeroforma arctica JP610]
MALEKTVTYTQNSGLCTLNRGFQQSLSRHRFGSVRAMHKSTIAAVSGGGEKYIDEKPRYGHANSNTAQKPHDRADGLQRSRIHRYTGERESRGGDREINQRAAENTRGGPSGTVLTTQRLISACMGLSGRSKVAQLAYGTLRDHVQEHIQSLSLEETLEITRSLKTLTKQRDRSIAKLMSGLTTMLKSHVEALATAELPTDAVEQKVLNGSVDWDSRPASVSLLAPSEVTMLCELFERLDMIFNVDLHDACDRRVCEGVDLFSTNELATIMQSFAYLNCGTYRFWSSTRARFETLCKYKHTSMREMMVAVNAMASASIQCDNLLRILCRNVGRMRISDSDEALWLIGQAAGAAGMLRPPQLREIIHSLMTPKVLQFLTSIRQPHLSSHELHQLVPVLWTLLHVRMHPEMVERLAKNVGDFRSPHNAQTRFMRHQASVMLACFSPHRAIHSDPTKPRSSRNKGGYGASLVQPFPQKKHVSGFENNINDVMVSMGLDTAIRQYQTEVGFSVDFAFPDAKVCIEAEGPHHYLVDPQTRSYRTDGTTNVKLMCLQETGWNFIQIPFWKWDLFREQEDKQLYLNSLLQPYLSCPGVISIQEELSLNLPYVQRSLRNYLSGEDSKLI